MSVWPDRAYAAVLVGARADALHGRAKRKWNERARGRRLSLLRPLHPLADSSLPVSHLLWAILGRSFPTKDARFLLEFATAPDGSGVTRNTVLSASDRSSSGEDGDSVGTATTNGLDPPFLCSHFRMN